MTLLTSDATRRGWTRRFDALLRRVPVGKDGAARVGARQIYILPTTTGLWYGTAVFLMLLGSLNYQNNLGLLFGFFLAAVGLAAMHHCWFNLLGLVVVARPGEPVFAGAMATFEVILRNERLGPRYDLRVTPGVEAIRAVFLDGQEQQVLTVRRATANRGWLPLREITLETRHPMHLFRAWCYAGTGAAVLVFARPANAAPRPVGEGGGDRRAAPRAGDGRDDYLGSRPYRRGDPPRQLDWKALARERGLVVKQFGGEEGQDVWIDWAQVSAADAETRIGLLTRQVLDATTANLRFGLRLPDVQLALGRGEAHRHACLRALALYDPAGLVVGERVPGC